MTYQAQCQICGKRQEVPTQGDWNCNKCEQQYVYEDGSEIVLSEDQIQVLREQTVDPSKVKKKEEQ